MIKYTITLVLFSLLISCGETYEMGPLFEQKIKNSSKVIYHYTAGSKINDSYKIGYILIDSTQEIVISKIKDLPLSFITEKPNKNLIKGIKVISPSKEDNMIKEEQINVDGIKIEIIRLHSLKDNSQPICFNQFYKFKSFEETEETLILSEIYEGNSQNPDELESITFPKGNIKLWASKNSTVSKIEIEKLIKDASGIILCKKRFIFEPLKPILINSFSDYGIFKQKR
jgi:hypothetical protein